MEDFFSTVPGLLLLVVWTTFALYLWYSRVIRPMSRSIVCGVKEVPVKVKQARDTGRKAAVFSLFLGIRGARKVSDSVGNMWKEAKEVDRKATEIERTPPK